MRSFQEDHELTARQTTGGKPAAAARPGSPSPAAAAPAATDSTKGRVSPIRQAAQLRPGSPPSTHATPKASAVAAEPAAAAAAAQPDEVTTFRTNIIIAVMALTVILLGMVAVNSGTNEALTFPRALVFFVDGASAADVDRAVALSRAPFIGMLGEAGASTLPLGPGACLHGSAAAIGSDADSAGLIVEMFTGSARGGSVSVLKRAKTAGFSIALLGGWPLQNELRGHGCWALSSECEESCMTKADSPSSKCNFDVSKGVAAPADFINATRDAINEGNHIVVVRVPVEAAEPSSAASRDEALYMADAAVGRAAMAAFERSAETNENLLVAVVVASASDPAAYVSITAFQADTQRVVQPFVRYPAPPRVGDVAAVLAAWLGLDLTGAPLASGVSNGIVCGTGAKPVDCDLSRR